MNKNLLVCFFIPLYHIKFPLPTFSKLLLPAVGIGFFYDRYSCNLKNNYYMNYIVVISASQTNRELLNVKFSILLLYKLYKNLPNTTSLLLLLLTNCMWFATIILAIFFLLIVLYQREYGKIAPSVVLYLRIRRWIIWVNSQLKII